MSQKLYSSIKKSVFGNLSFYLLQIISMIFYARMFTPAEFGIVASVQVFVIFFQLFSDLGLSPALLSLEKIKDELRDSVFTFTIVLGVVIGLIFYGFTFFLNIYYENPSYSFYGIFISIAIIFQTTATIPTVALHRETKFYAIAAVNIFSEIFTFIVVMVLYSLDYGVVILFIRILLFSILRFLLLYILSRNTILKLAKLSVNFSHLSEVMRFSLFQFSFNVVNYFSRNLDNILIGKYLSIEALGIYDKSYQLMRYPLQLITYSINPAIQPILSGEKRELIIVEHNKLIEKLLVISIPIALFMGINSEHVVLVLFGEQWGKVNVLVSILSCIIPIQMVLSTSGAFFQSLKKPQLLFYSGAIAAVINIAFIITGVYLGNIVSVAICLCISYTLSFIVIYHVLFKYAFCISCFDFYRTIVKITWCYAPVILLYPVIIWQLSISTNIIFFDLLLSGTLLLILLAIFNFNMLKVTLLPKNKVNNE
ncbi:MAG: oligosaccharide flippase family protein [Colwellia sp.]|nr:oligosaccharide flippase family protein [Colwellia sp.]